MAMIALEEEQDSKRRRTGSKCSGVEGCDVDRIHRLIALVIIKQSSAVLFELPWPHVPPSPLLLARDSQLRSDDRKRMPYNL